MNAAATPPRQLNTRTATPSHSTIHHGKPLSGPFGESASRDVLGGQCVRI